MIWILLATIGIPLWLMGGVVLAAVLSRRAFRRGPGVFRCKLRAGPGDAVAGIDRWPRRPSDAVWVHDVLLVHHGLALIRVEPLGVAGVAECAPGADGEPRGLGSRPSMLTLVVDDGAEVQLAAPGDLSDTMAGPFLGAIGRSASDGV
jgi:hypothetical protein